MAETIQEQYIRMNPRSRELQPSYRARFPSGSPGHDGYTSDPFPVVIARGSGPRKWDIDGKRVRRLRDGISISPARPCPSRGRRRAFRRPG